MRLPPFLLDRWLSDHQFASPPIRYDLAASTGPVWTLGELLALGDGASRDDLDALRLSYVPANGGEGLRRRIAELHDVDPDWVVVTTGASEALSALFCLVSEPGASIVLPFPVFPAMPVMARAWGLNVRTYELSRARGFEQSAELISAAVDEHTRLVIVNTPHNPTGAVMPPQEIAKLAQTLADRNVPLIVDEVYHRLYFAAPAPTAARLSNTIVVGDMSKALSLSGLRIGWLIDRDPVRREHLINARSYFTVSGSPITEAIAATALAAVPAILSRLESVSRTNLALLDQFMGEHGKSIAWVRPDGGTTAFPWLIDGRNARPLSEALAREGVLVAPGDCFDAPEHFRIGFGAQASGFQEALAVAGRVIDSYGLRPGFNGVRCPTRTPIENGLP